MPGRVSSLLIVVFWLVCASWFVRREYLPRWLASDNGPEFTVDLADEAAPRYTTWNIVRDDRKIGFLSCRMTFQPASDRFEVENRFQNLELSVASPLIKVEVKVPSIIATSIVDKEGRLHSLQSESEFKLLFDAPFGMKTALPELQLKARLSGEVQNGLFTGTSEIKSPLGDSKTTLKPFEVSQGNLFNPMQPQDRIFGLKPGRSWKVTLLDPISETIMQAAMQSVGNLARTAGRDADGLPKLPQSGSNEYIAEVLSLPEKLDWKGAAEECHVIEYRNDSVAGRTWVRISDGKVLQQEALGHGEKLTLTRDN